MAEEKRSYGGSQQGGERGERRFFAKPKFCQFCADKTLTINYKKGELLRKFVNEDGNIRPRRQTGNCAKHQRVVAVAVKQARQVALLNFVGGKVEDSR